ncbi:MAG: PIG-L family deacetylase [Planctomycetes bacterium]|nr:PIG-L family deacetylase [Planctomycetota bacterium]
MLERRYPPLVPAARLTRGTALVLAPHPDDEVAACGGMLLHHVDAGLPVEVAFLTDGARGSWKTAADPDYVGLREREARAACAFLGTRAPRFLGFPDGGLAADEHLVGAVRALLREIRPEVVYCPSFFEIHGDHRRTARALMEALEGADLDPLLLFAELGAPVWANVLVDITAVMERKVRALRHYESQLSANDYAPAMKGLNQYRTVNIDIQGVDCAEAFLAGRRRELVAIPPLVDRIAALADRAVPDDWTRPG